METKNKPTAARFIVKGVNDDKDFCECCGKQGIARVVWIEDTHTGALNHFGTTCATKPAKCFGITKADLKPALDKFETLEAMTWRTVHRECRALGLKSGNGEPESIPAETIAKRKELYPIARAKILSLNPHLAQ